MEVTSETANSLEAVYGLSMEVLDAVQLLETILEEKFDKSSSGKDVNSYLKDSIVICPNYDETKESYRLDSSIDLRTIIYTSSGSSSLRSETAEKLVDLKIDGRLLATVQSVDLIQRAPIIAGSHLINIIDLEATCWDKHEEQGINEIIEIGITVVDIRSLSIVSTDSLLVKPIRSTISTFCTWLTTMTPELIDREGIPFPEAIKILKSKYDFDNRRMGSYGDFDRTMFLKELERHGLESTFYKGHFNVKSFVRDAFQWRRAVGMDKALSKLGIVLEGVHHRGCDDSRNTAVMFLRVFAEQDKSHASKVIDDYQLR
jgi:inhibitor of KinA sporulation pathway (predicted exonuclease)